MYLTAPWWKRCKEPCSVLKIKEALMYMGISPGGGSPVLPVSAPQDFLLLKLWRRVFSTLPLSGNHNTTGIYES